MEFFIVLSDMGGMQVYVHTSASTDHDQVGSYCDILQLAPLLSFGRHGRIQLIDICKLSAEWVKIMLETAYTEVQLSNSHPLSLPQMRPPHSEYQLVL